MYFLDGFKTVPFAVGKRWFLVNSNPVLVDIFVQSIQKVHSINKTYRLSGGDSPPEFLFEASPILYIFAPTSTFTDIVIKPEDIIIKIAKSSVSAKWKKLGFEEIVCSDMFPSQLGQFIDLLERYGVIHKATPIDFSVFQYSMLDLLNAQRVFSHGGAVAEVIIDDVVKLTELYLDRNYKLFFDMLLKSKVDTNYLLNSLLYNFLTLYKMQSGIETVKSPWLKNKINSRLGLYSGVNLDNIITFLTFLISESRKRNKYNPQLDLLRLSLFLQNKIGALLYAR